MILITGGSGFVGTKLIEKITSKEHKIINIDLQEPKIKNNQIYYKTDIRTLDELERVFTKEKIDTVFHLAAQTSVEYSTNNPYEDFKTNVIGTINLLKLSKKHNIKQFILFSSAAVYGMPKTMPINEKEQLKPLSPYGIHKFIAEMETKIYFPENHIIVRPFNIYGPNQNKNYSGVIDIFLEQSKTNNPITIQGNGMQTRDFIYIDDVVSIVINLFKNNNYGTYNLGTGIKTTINELANTIKQITKSESKIVHIDKRLNDIEHSYADTNSINTKNISTKYTLFKGLNKLIL